MQNWTNFRNINNTFPFFQTRSKLKNIQFIVKKNGDFIGYTNTLDPFEKIASLDSDLIDLSNKTIASHVLQLMIRGVTFNLKFQVAHYPTTTAVGENLNSIIWRNMQIRSCRIQKFSHRRRWSFNESKNFYIKQRGFRKF